ncbi:MAG: hypothetical protein H6686_07425 [Fibrobacteria bacterium]|nr:hypothetical protein [Fibrobacteria bacterium]
MSKVEGCLAEGSANFPGGYTWSYDSTVWYDWILSGWGGPRVPRLELGAWDNTACTYRIDLKPGDSLLLEYKLTPADTAVADTIRGSMMVEWIGYTWSTAVDPSRPRTAARPWREENAVHLPLNFSGEWAVHDPSGRRIPTRSEGKADGIRLVLPRGARDRLLLLTGPAGSFVLPPPRR